MKTLAHRHGTERGAAAVEFGLVLPLLLLLVMGAIDWGYYFYVTQVVTNAAREGARAGTLEPTDDDAALFEAQAMATRYLQGANLNLGNATVNEALDGNAIEVTIQYSVGSITGVGQAFVPAFVRAHAEMRRF